LVKEPVIEIKLVSKYRIIPGASIFLDAAAIRFSALSIRAKRFH